MQICYLADGRSVHTKRWMKFFADQGHEMHLISFAPMSVGNVADFERIGVKCYGDIGNLHVKRFWLTLSDLRRLRTILKGEKIDILHSHFLGTNVWYAALSGFHPHIITIMGGGDVVGKDWKPGSEIRERYLTPFALRNADTITSWSKLMADVVRPYCDPKTPIEVIHGGIHLEKFSPGPKPQYLLDRFDLPADAKILFSPRLMRPLSNIHQIAKAMKLITDAVPSTYLVIACPAHVIDEEYKTEIERILEQDGTARNMRFVVGIPHDEMAEFFRLADVTISIPVTDGTPMTVLESMACGTPTVIGDLDDYDERYFENELTALMVDTTSENDVARAVIRYLTEQNISDSVANEARRRVLEDAGYENQMRKMEEIYFALAH